MIRITRKRIVVTTVLLLLLTGILVVTWDVCNWPPPRLILKYGFPPAGGPTGKSKTLAGLEFIEIEGGYRHIRRRIRSSSGTSLVDWVKREFLLLGSPSRRPPGHVDRWVEVPDRFWVSQFRANVEEHCIRQELHHHLAGMLPITQDEEGVLAKLCEELSRREGGRFFRPSPDQLLFASATGALEEGGIEVLGPMVFTPELWDDSTVLVGDFWQTFAGTQQEAIDIFLGSETPRCYRIGWSPHCTP